MNECQGILLTSNSPKIKVNKVNCLRNYELKEGQEEREKILTKLLTASASG